MRRILPAKYEKFQKDTLGVAALASGLFLLLALGSYSPKDPSLNSIVTMTGSAGRVHNFCGYFGSFVSDLLLQAFGVVAFALPLAAFVHGIQLIRARSTGLFSARAILAGVFFLDVSALVHLHLSQWKLFSGQIPAGGVLGYALAQTLIKAFNFHGVALLLWAVFLILTVYLTEIALLEFIHKMWPGGKSVLGLLKKSVQTLAALTTLSKIKLPKSPLERAAKSEPKLRLKTPDDIEAAECPSVAPKLQVIPQISNERRRVQLKAKVERSVENWKLPEIGILEDPPMSRVRVDEREIRAKSEQLIAKLDQFDVGGEIVAARPGPAVTLYEFRPNADVKISKITELADDLRLALSSESVRIIAPIPGRDVVGIETSNAHRETVYLKDIIAHEDFWTENIKLPIALGRQANGEVKVVDLRKMPHLMVAGTTGSGKSVFMVSAITALTFRHSPKTLRLILIDPKQVDLAVFSKIPHLLMPPVKEARKAVMSLKWAVKEMEKRYRSMSRFQARNLEDFNKTVGELKKNELDEHEQLNHDMENDNQKGEQYYFTPQPLIVIAVEEFGDLMAVDKQNVEHLVVRLAQMARACGMHIILAMQSPRKDVVTGLIKTNIPGRISFKVASKMDSRIILDDGGAERLLAQGDMLMLAPGFGVPQRHHGPWVSDKEIEDVMDFWSDQGEPQFDPNILKSIEGSADGADGGSLELGFGDDEHDELYDQILAWVATQKEVSASLLQRRFKLGYPRASRLIEQFEREGVVGPANGSKPRAVLIESHIAPEA